MKIKVFKFLVSNWTSSCFDSDISNADYVSSAKRLYTPEQVEGIVNSFCNGKNVVDVRVNNVDVNYHNNGRGNAVELWYTVIYREEVVCG